jgi:hypothetical protein
LNTKNEAFSSRVEPWCLCIPGEAQGRADLEWELFRNDLLGWATGSFGHERQQAPHGQDWHVPSGRPGPSTGNPSAHLSGAGSTAWEALLATEHHRCVINHVTVTVTVTWLEPWSPRHSRGADWFLNKCLSCWQVFMFVAPPCIFLWYRGFLFLSRCEHSAAKGRAENGPFLGFLRTCRCPYGCAAKGGRREGEETIGGGRKREMRMGVKGEGKGRRRRGGEREGGRKEDRWGFQLDMSDRLGKLQCLDGYTQNHTGY